MKRTGLCTWVDSERALADLLKENQRVVALWYASWCPFCNRFLPLFERLMETELSGITFAVVQDDGEKLAAGYAVAVYPTLLCFAGGILAKRLDGAPGVGLTEGQLSDFISSCRTPL